MEKLYIKGKADTPEILADGNNGLFELSGKSLPEDSIAFYGPLDEYVREYIKNPKENTVINLRPLYLNSSSAKRLVDIINRFTELVGKGYSVKLNWYNPDDDEDIEDEGKEFAYMTKLPINFVK